MMMNKVEHLILSSALEDAESLVNVAEDWQLSRAEIAVAADNLFQNSDIRARKLINGEITTELIPTMSEIEETLEGKSNGFCYYLTSQGGTRWEAVAYPDWNRYFICVPLGSSPWYRGLGRAGTVEGNLLEFTKGL